MRAPAVYPFLADVWAPEVEVLLAFRQLSCIIVASLLIIFQWDLITFLSAFAIEEELKSLLVLAFSLSLCNKYP